MKRRGFLAALLAAIPLPCFLRKPPLDSDHNCEWLSPDPCPYCMNITTPSHIDVTIMAGDMSEIISRYTITLPNHPVG